MRELKAIIAGAKAILAERQRQTYGTTSELSANEIRTRLVEAAQLSDGIDILEAVLTGRVYRSWYIVPNINGGFVAERPGLELDEEARVHLTESDAKDWADEYDAEHGEEVRSVLYGAGDDEHITLNTVRCLMDDVKNAPDYLPLFVYLDKGQLRYPAEIGYRDGEEAHLFVNLEPID